MRTDLLDADAAVQWAVTQIELLQESLVKWQNRKPYGTVTEHDPETGDQLLVPIERIPLPLTVNAWVGAILNSLRSSLDLLAAALAARNGEKTNRYRHFPIFDCLHDMIDPVLGIDGAERKKWLSESERSAIKKLEPYKGGNGDAIWALHNLDIIRKHERLIYAKPQINGVLIFGSIEHWSIYGGRSIERLHDKTILARRPPGESFTSTESNTLFAISVMLKEAAIGLADEDVLPALWNFTNQVGSVIRTFDAP